MSLKIAVRLMVLLGLMAMFSCGQKYRKRPDTKIKASNVTLEVVARSVVTCVAQCDVRPPCASVSFQPTTGTCLLSTALTFHDEWNNTMPDACESAVGWTTVLNISHPVIHLIGSGPARYQLNMTDAQEVCDSYGTEVATPQDLLDARAMGFELCGCGWLSDQTNGFVLQEPNSVCWLDFHTGILNCGFAKADVYCKAFF